jgi:hypothetical protein
MSQFPSSTTLIVGPNFTSQKLPPYPKNPDSPVQESDFADREIREITFPEDANKLRIGRFNAFDFFGDGSFYLLDTPGHEVGHLCGLARTTANANDNDTFVFMGGDCCHHGAEFRPTEYLPLPSELTPEMVPKFRAICPGTLIRDSLHPQKSAITPLFEMTEKFPYNYEEAEWTVSGVEEFDANDNILVVVAHDEDLVDILDFYPKSLNPWKKKGFGVKGKWAFLGDFKIEQ